MAPVLDGRELEVECPRRTVAAAAGIDLPATAVQRELCTRSQGAQTRSDQAQCFVEPESAPLAQAGAWITLLHANQHSSSQSVVAFCLKLPANQKLTFIQLKSRSRRASCLLPDAPANQSAQQAMLSAV